MALASLIGPSTIHTDSMGIIDELCTGKKDKQKAKQKDADLWIDGSCGEEVELAREPCESASYREGEESFGERTYICCGRKWQHASIGCAACFHVEEWKTRTMVDSNFMAQRGCGISWNKESGKRKESKNVVRDCKAMAKEELWSGWNQVKEQVLGKSTGDTGRNRKEELNGKRGVRQDFVTREAIWRKLFV